MITRINCGVTDIRRYYKNQFTGINAMTLKHDDDGNVDVNISADLFDDYNDIATPKLRM